MTKEIISKLIEKGYSGDNSLSSIEWWFRSVKKIHCEIFFSMFHKKWAINGYFIDLKKLKKIEHSAKDIKFDTYEEALEYSIEQMLLKV